MAAEQIVHKKTVPLGYMLLCVPICAVALKVHHAWIAKRSVALMLDRHNIFQLFLLSVVLISRLTLLKFL